MNKLKLPNNDAFHLTIFEKYAEIIKDNGSLKSPSKIKSNSNRYLEIVFQKNPFGSF